MKITIRQLKKIIKEVVESEFQVNRLYHGTSSRAAREIRKNGFSAELLGSKSGEQHKMPGISTSTDYDAAEGHAEWAAERHDDDPEVLTIDASNLRIAPGSLYFELWNELGSSDRSIQKIKSMGEWDGVSLFDAETGEGIEELEVLIFNPDLIRIIS